MCEIYHASPCGDGPTAFASGLKTLHVASQRRRRQRGGLVAVRDELRCVYGCAEIVYAWLASVHASLRVSGGSARDTGLILLSHNQESKSCMPAEAARVPLDLETGVAYDAVLAEIK